MSCLLAHPLQQHIRRNLQHDNAQKHQLVAQVDRVLVDADISRKAAGQGAAYVHAVELEDGQAEEEEEEDGEVGSEGSETETSLVHSML